MRELAGRDRCAAAVTDKREMENYIHPRAIEEAYAANGISIQLDSPFGDFDDVPAIVAGKVSAASGGRDWLALDDDARRIKARRAKAILNDAAVKRMTGGRLSEIDPKDEVRGWLSAINDLINSADM